MFKKFAIFTVIAALTLNVVGCNKKETKETKENLKVTMILDEGGINDGSFNESSYEGLVKAQQELGIEISYLESKQEADYAANIETAIDNENDLIIGVGFKLADAFEEAALNYPEQKFAIIDSSYENTPENLTSLMFNEEESGYLVGLIAAKTTKTNVVGFVGGMDIPSCSNFAVGFEKALKETNPEITLLKQYANSFTDAAKGKAIANQMISKNADIIFAAGGGVNTGVYEICNENNIKAIGVDKPCNEEMPEVIITSALKRVDVAVYNVIENLLNNKFYGGTEIRYTIENGGIDYEKTKHLDDELIKFVDSYKK